MKPDRIHPFYLPEGAAHELITRHAYTELRDGLLLKCNPVVSCWACVHGDGRVELGAHYRDDNGYCQSSGPLFPSVWVRPYSDSDLETLRDQEMFRLASEELGRREEDARVKRILKIKREMFGT